MAKSKEEKGYESTSILERPSPRVLRASFPLRKESWGSDLEGRRSKLCKTLRSVNPFTSLEGDLEEGYIVQQEAKENAHGRQEYVDQMK